MTKNLTKSNFVLESKLSEEISVSDVEKIFALVIKKYANKIDFVVSLAFVSPQEIKKINKKFSNNDYPTDVLSFNYPKEKFVSDIKQNIGGEIIICTKIAQKNATKNDIDLRSELALLITHGLLHIAGFDHQNQKDQTSFDSMQSDILSILGFKYRKMQWLA